MREVLWKVLGLAFTSPFTLAAWAWTLIMVMASAALVLSIPMVFWEVGGEFIRRGVELKGVLTALFFFVFFAGGAAFTFYVTWMSGTFTWSLTRDLSQDVREAVDTTRVVLTERADQAQRQDEQGGQISLSLGDDSGGGLSQAAQAEDGLELVDALEEVEEVEEVGRA